MRGAWRLPSSSERAVPVEMRFIDMFMAAVGALIFMAMLLSFLLRYLPSSPGAGPAPPRIPPASVLRIATRSLPPARAGEPYEVAFAYRGGSGAVAWQVPAGLEELPAGLRIDPRRGLLSGTPGERGTARFVLQVSDSRGGTHRQPLELVIEASKNGSRRLETTFAVILIALLLLAWLATLAGMSEFRERLGTLQAAWSRGDPSLTWSHGPHEIETIHLPGGIDIYQGRLQTTRRSSRILFFVLLLSLAWFAWRIWGG